MTTPRDARGTQGVDNSSVIATYRLPFAIAFDEGCAGTEARTRVGSVDVRVVLPRISWLDDVPQVDAPLMPAEAGGDVATWGEVAGWDPNARTVDGWWAKGVVFKADTGSLSVDATTEGLFAAVGSWTNRLAGWVETIMGQDAGRIGPLRNVTVDGEGLAVWVNGDVFRDSSTTRGMTVLSHTSATIDAETWALILREVGDGSEVPDEHGLLSDARASFRREDYRRAVIHAAAAAELVLAELLDWKFAAAPPAVENQFPLERRTLGPLKDLLAPLVPVAKDRLDALVMTRNAVMHKSYAATSAEAAEAVAVAEELVALIYPTDALLSR